MGKTIMPELLTYEITFGDCDPAGIVFYPNTFRWMDAAFHKLLRKHGGHAYLCETLGALGVGLVDASAQFQKPMRDGEQLSLRIANLKWSRRTLTIHYGGEVDGSARFKGHEVRCLFKETKDGIVAGEIEQLRQLLEPSNE
jgi:4-hydroxybenzoyl-CoA thioesterase